jgi:hypothetical protein
VNYSSPRPLAGGGQACARTGRAVLVALAGAAALLGAGFVAYDDAPLALSLANLCLSF